MRGRTARKESSRSKSRESTVLERLSSPAPEGEGEEQPPSPERDGPATGEDREPNPRPEGPGRGEQARPTAELSRSELPPERPAGGGGITSSGTSATEEVDKEEADV